VRKEVNKQTIYIAPKSTHDHRALPTRSLYRTLWQLWQSVSLVPHWR